MTDPASSGAAGAVAFKAVGGASAVAAGCAGLAAIVAMLMMPPRSPCEWAVGLISTVAREITTPDRRFESRTVGRLVRGRKRLGVARGAQWFFLAPFARNLALWVTDRVIDKITGPCGSPATA